MAWLQSIVQRYFPKHTRSVRAQLKALSTSNNETMRRAATNFRVDSRPSGTAWKAIVRALLKSHRDVHAIHVGVRAAIDLAKRRGAHGPRARLSASTTRFGRVINADVYYRMMFGPSSTSSPLKTSNDALFRNLCSAELEDQRAILERRDLGSFTMWSTFDPETNAPFASIPLDVHSLRAALALDPPMPDDVLLVFEYTLPPGVETRIPTVCDAYAGPTWPAFFRPSRPHEPYGYTDPLKSSGMERRPEVVHEVITGKTLAERILKIPNA